MEQLINASLPHGSFGALLRACRRRAYLSQEQLAARATLSERTVRNLEADRVRSPRNDTVRLLADTLKLTEPERESWFAAARDMGGRRAEPAIPGAGGPALPDDDSGFTGRERELARIEAVLNAGAQDAFRLALTCLIDRTGTTVLAVQCAHRAAAPRLAGQADVAVGPSRPLLPGHPGCLFLVSSRHHDDGLAVCDGVLRVTFDKLTRAR